MSAALRCLDAVKTFEYVWQFCRRYAYAGVANPQNGTPGFSADADVYFTLEGELKALESRLKTIFSHMSLSTRTGCGSGSHRTFEFEASSLHHRAKHARQIGGKGA